MGSDETVDVLIIGAGPSGSVASAYLHNKGINVKVIEKSKFPRFVVGESLLPRCMDHFEEVGLIDCLKAQNFEKKNGARFLRGEQVCEFDFSTSYILARLLSATTTQVLDIDYLLCLKVPDKMLALFKLKLCTGIVSDNWKVW